jgi:chromosome segregation ATPase
LKVIVTEMRKEMETIRERSAGISGSSGSAGQAAQTIFELRRELYKLQAEKKSVELEKEFLESQSRQAEVDAEMYRQMSDKEGELYECKIRLI